MGETSKGKVDILLLAQMTLSMVSVLQAGDGSQAGGGAKAYMGQMYEGHCTYIEFQVAKLKGLCCTQNHTNLLAFWDYFNGTKVANAQCTQLVEAMKHWTKKNTVHINKDIYFDKGTIDNNVHLKFCPSTPTAYLRMVKQGISILICCCCSGNERADIWSKE